MAFDIDECQDVVFALRLLNYLCMLEELGIITKEESIALSVLLKVAIRSITDKMLSKV